MLRHSRLITLLLLGLASFSWGEEAFPKGEPIALSMPGEFYMAPQWSPAGDQVAAAGPSYTGLYLIDFPTGNSHQISNAYSAGYGFAWSHAGTRIASRISSYENKRRTNTLVSYNLDDGTVEILSEPRTRMSGTPLWSSNDSHIYLTNSETFESFSTDNKNHESLNEALLYVKNSQIIRIATAKAEENAVFTDQGRVTSYAVSPDGSRIVYSTSGQHLWIANSDGNERHSLGSGIAPSWAPDGEWIVFMFTEDDGHAILNSDLYLVKADGTARKNITNTSNQLEMHPHWSPDGSWIVFDTEGRGQLFVQQVEWR